MTKLLAFLDGVLVYVFVSGVLSLSLALFLPSWRKNAGAVLLSAVLGGFAGYAAEPIPALSNWSILISLVVTIMATPFAAWAMSGGDMKSLARDIIEVGEYIRNRKRGGGDYD